MFPLINITTVKAAARLATKIAQRLNSCWQYAGHLQLKQFNQICTEINNKKWRLWLSKSTPPPKIKHTKQYKEAPQNNNLVHKQFNTIIQKRGGGGAGMKTKHQQFFINLSIPWVSTSQITFQYHKLLDPWIPWRWQPTKWLVLSRKCQKRQS